MNDDTLHLWDGKDWYDCKKKVTHIASGKPYWCLNESNEALMKKDITWENKNGKFIDLSVGNDGTAWGLQENGKIRSFESEEWKTIPG